MKSVIFNKAGKIALTKYVGGSLTHTPENMCIRNGTVESIQESPTINTQDLPDGNSDWPMGVYDTGNSGQVTVTLSSYQPELYAFLLGTSIEKLVSKSMRQNDEEILIPSVSPFTATLKHTPNTNITPIVLGEDSSPFAKVSATPATGQFSISADVVTFNSADAGKNVFATYDWTASTAEAVGMPKIASRPTLYAIISGEAVSEDESTVYDTNIIIDRCKAVGDVNPPQKGREAQPWSFNLRILKPRGNNKAIDTVFAKRS